MSESCKKHREVTDTGNVKFTPQYPPDEVVDNFFLVFARCCEEAIEKRTGMRLEIEPHWERKEGGGKDVY